MARWMKLALAGLGLIGAGLASAAWFGSVRWSGATSRYVERLLQNPAQQKGKTVVFENFEQLPPPVAKYLRFALKEGQPLIRSARIAQIGELRGFEKPHGGWSPFEATQYFALRPPGFVWDARIRMAPLIKVRVRDACVSGQGSAHVSLLSIITLATKKRSPSLIPAICSVTWPRQSGSQPRFFQAQASHGVQTPTEPWPR